MAIFGSDGFIEKLNFQWNAFEIELKKFFLLH